MADNASNVIMQSFDKDLDLIRFRYLKKGTGLIKNCSNNSLIEKLQTPTLSDNIKSQMPDLIQRIETVHAMTPFKSYIIRYPCILNTVKFLPSANLYKASLYLLLPLQYGRRCGRYNSPPSTAASLRSTKNGSRRRKHRGRHRRAASAELEEAPAAESIQPEVALEFEVVAAAATTAVDTPSTADVAAGSG